MRGNALLIMGLSFTLFFFSCSMPGRNGQSMYSDFFGDSSDTCTEIINSRDARALDDCCVWLHFRTCPGEVARILRKVPYTVEKMDKAIMSTAFTDTSRINEEMTGADPPKWWSLLKLGDSCLKFEYKEPDKDHMQIAYISMDSTEVFYDDVDW